MPNDEHNDVRLIRPSPHPLSEPRDVNSERGETMKPARQSRPEIDRTMLVIGAIYASVLLAFVVRAAATLP